MSPALLGEGAPVVRLVAASTPADADVSPGLVGFLVTFAVAVVTVLLILDLTRRLRRIKHRELLEEQRLADEALVAGGGGTTGADRAVPDGEAHAGGGGLDDRTATGPASSSGTSDQDRPGGPHERRRDEHQ